MFGRVKPQGPPNVPLRDGTTYQKPSQAHQDGPGASDSPKPGRYASALQEAFDSVLSENKVRKVYYLLYLHEGVVVKMSHSFDMNKRNLALADAVRQLQQKIQHYVPSHMPRFDAVQVMEGDIEFKSQEVS